MPPFFVDYWCPSIGNWREAGDVSGYPSFDYAMGVLRQLKANASFPTQWVVVDGNGQVVYQE